MVTLFEERIFDAGADQSFSDLSSIYPFGWRLFSIHRFANRPERSHFYLSRLNPYDSPQKSVHGMCMVFSPSFVVTALKKILIYIDATAVTLYACFTSEPSRGGRER